ncbi:polysaccharide export outer membrane protein [Catalinimonas alkaloidigena]|uniref:polysaccharide biosynthesis/export family protein n=1 Tax=Catalinimonas alkaloidigena TaxID=1075417 RepID=UPI00240579D6|nr:polysaccharide biosynthesis/export family protein [Catalinimonas alkaloidigena]MDF9799452.1 polysaccharide export outer membrane protein [Catalinimonas alkaloidigena]
MIQTLIGLSKYLLFFLCVAGVLSSCGIYKNRILFRTETELVPENVLLAVEDAKKNYTLQENDYIEVEVYTNEGELIIDPNNEIRRELNSGAGNQQFRQQQERPQFLLREGGMVKLPLIGDVDLAGLTLYEADSLLETEYSAYYEEAFVITRYVNKRVVVLGSTGGKVIPLQNENTNLIEILALAGGVGTQSRVDKIRLIRGDLNDPEVRIINLSTIEGMTDASLKVLPNDIIYVQPVQRVTSEAVRDISPILSLITSTLTLIVLINNFSNN